MTGYGRSPLSARPAALSRALIALAVAWAATLANLGLLIALAVDLTPVGHPRFGDQGGLGALIPEDHVDSGAVVIENLYPVVLVVTSILVLLLPVGARLVRRGDSSGRLFITGMTVVSLPVLLGCAWIACLRALEGVPDDGFAYFVWSGSPAAVAGVSLATAVLCLWRPSATAYLRSSRHTSLPESR